MCKRIKTFKKNKHELFKSLSISKRYFQNILINLIVAFSFCKRNEKECKYVMIVINKLNKKKRFITLIFFLK